MPAPDTTWPHSPARAHFWPETASFGWRATSRASTRATRQAECQKLLLALSFSLNQGLTSSCTLRWGMLRHRLYTGSRAPSKAGLQVPAAVTCLLHYGCFPVSKCFFLLPNELGVLAFTPLSGELNLRKRLIAGWPKDILTKHSRFLSQFHLKSFSKR